MVALCEFSKIPLAIAIWHTKKSKILYIFFTLVVCTITFDTLFNGFERNFAALAFQAKEIEIEIEIEIEKNSLEKFIESNIKNLIY